MSGRECELTGETMGRESSSPHGGPRGFPAFPRDRPSHASRARESLPLRPDCCIVQHAERSYGLDIKDAPPASGAADYDNNQVVSQDSLSLPAVPSTCRLSTLRAVSGDRRVTRTLPYGVLELE